MRIIGVLISAFLLLNSCSSPKIDPRFAAPETTFKAYWEAKKEHNVDVMWECLSKADRRNRLAKRFIKKYGQLSPETARMMSVEVLDVIIKDETATMKYEERLKHLSSDKTVRVIHSVDLTKEKDGWKIRLSSDQILKDETLRAKESIKPISQKKE